MGIKSYLTDDQKAILNIFKDNTTLSSVFYLTGGTALTEFYLQHRYSDDLDFFTEKDFPQIEVEKFIETAKQRLNAKMVSYRKLYDRRIYIFEFQNKPDLKIEFSLYSFKQINQPVNKDSVLIDSMEDIAANKLMTIIDRNEPKDFFDLYFLLKYHFNLKQLYEYATKKFGVNVELLTLGSELLKVKNMNFAIIRPIIKITDEEIKNFFQEQAVALRKEILE